MGIKGDAETLVNTTTVGDQDVSELTLLDNGGWVVSWYSELPDTNYSQAFNADGSKSGGQTSIAAGAAVNQWRSDFTLLPSGKWVVITEEYGGGGPGSYLDVYQQIYNADGSPDGAKAMVNNWTFDNQSGSSIVALVNGGWLVTWSSKLQDGSGSGIYQQVFDSSGVSAGEVRVNSWTAADQYDSHTIALADGGWVTTWTSSDQDGSLDGVYLQRYNANGTVHGDETSVNTTTENFQYLPQIAALTGGGWVVTWMSNGQDGSSYGIYQQAYQADGAPLGAENRVNTFVTGRQADQQVVGLADGGWVVVWESDGQDGGGEGIYQQVYNADGSRDGEETRVNVTATFAQIDPQVLALANGGWVVSWTSDGQDGYGSGIYQRVFHRGVYTPGDTIIGTSESETLRGTNFAESIFGMGGKDVIDGRKGADQIDGGAGNDRLTGGAGADTFVFGTNAGKDTITDFTTFGKAHDIIDLSDIDQITSYRDLMRNHAHERGGDIVISISAKSSITLDNVDLAELGKGDFVF